MFDKLIPFLSLLLCFATTETNGQSFRTPDTISCFKGEFAGKSTVSSKILSQKGKLVPASEIEVTYIDFPAEAKEAFEKAVEIWQYYIVSTVPIRIKATWSGDLANNTLAQSSASRIVSNFDNAPYKDIWYVLPLAEALAGKDLNDGDVDMTITMNKNITWYYGGNLEIDNRQYDLCSIALHEIAHGLGFSSSFKETSNNRGEWGQSGNAYVYDIFVQGGDLQKLVDPAKLGNPSNELYQYFVNSDLFFEVIDPIFGADLPKLQSYAPFQIGKSISHLDELEYPNGDEHSLMTPNIGPAEIAQDPGLKTLSILERIGWTISNIPVNRPLNTIAETNPQLLLYPNPVGDFTFLYIPNSLKADKFELVISNANGQVIFHNSVMENSDSNIKLDTTLWPAGLYILNLSSKSEKFTKRILKL